MWLDGDSAATDSVFGLMYARTVCVCHDESSFVLRVSERNKRLSVVIRSSRSTDSADDRALCSCTVISTPKTTHYARL